MSSPFNSSDTNDLHSDRFHTVNWHINYLLAKQLKPNSISHISYQSPTNILLECHYRGSVLRLQAPLRHWNHRPKPKAWQIETGPILWPLSIDKFLDSPCSVGLTTSWLHANNDNLITVSGDRLVAREIDAHLSLLSPV